MSDKYEQLMALKDITQRTGIIHHLQLLQLQLYPVALFNAKDAAVAVDSEEKTIVYDLNLKKKPVKFKETAGSLVLWTEELLGSDWNVKVLIPKTNRILQRKSKNK